MNLCGLMTFLNRQHPQNKQEHGAGTNGKERDSVGRDQTTSTALAELPATERWNATVWPQQRLFSLMWFRLSE